MVNKSKRSPGLLPHVVQAIADLRDSRGSPVSHIVDQIKGAFNTSNIEHAAIVHEVRKALRHGIDSGLLRYNSGKYRMALSDVSKGGIPSSGDGLAKSSRRRRRRRSGSKRRRRRRRSTSGRRRRRRRRRSSSDGRYRTRSVSEVSNTSKKSDENEANKKPQGSDREDNKQAEEADLSRTKSIRNLRKRASKASTVTRKRRCSKTKIEDVNDNDVGFEPLPKKSVARIRSRSGTSRLSRRSRSRKLEEINEQLNLAQPEGGDSKSSFEDNMFRTNHDNDDKDFTRDSYIN